jgi:hypothetical protein
LWYRETKLEKKTDGSMESEVLKEEKREEHG